MSSTEPSTPADPEAAADPEVAASPVAAVAGAARAASPSLDGDGRERPRFITTFPDDPALNTLTAAFERGDFSYVRKHSKHLIDEGSSAEVKAAAAELRRRVEPDPSVVLLLGLAAAVFSFLVFWVYIGR